jgi:hypothetical protein
MPDPIDLHAQVTATQPDIFQQLRHPNALVSFKAKGRIERCFGTLQDRLVKGLRQVDAKTAEEANRYLE